MEQRMEQKKRRKGIVIMGELIGLVKPLLPLMCLAILLGVLGYLCAIFLTIFAGYGMLHGLFERLELNTDTVSVGFFLSRTPGVMAAILLILAVLRGVLHYGEQYCNHFIAFKLLAIIRHKVFAALRKLCPAKLEGRDKGNLISIITSDIELLEVFYAHTISPIAIAIVTSLIMVFFIGSQYAPAGMIALLGYLVVGAVIPIWNGKKLNRHEAAQGSLTNMVILLFSFGMLFFMLWKFECGVVSFDSMLIAVIAMMGSFGPVTALSSLSNNLKQTLASGERVLALLEEKPQIEEISGKEATEFAGAVAEHVDFVYEEEQILKDYSIVFPKGKVVGIHGASGSGKSTLLKLLMRFWDVDSGSIQISGKDIRKINTKDLRDMESYVTQETYLFHDSIANNIAVGKPGATREEIIGAAIKASIHDFIMTLPKGYDTEVGELGDTLSGGEKQRIGIARAFLHDAPLMLLDEPTSNLDSLNEGIILKSLHESREDKTVVLVSHRKSTMNVADVVYEMENGRMS